MSKLTQMLSTNLSIKEQLSYAGGIFGNAMGQDSVHTYGDKFARNFMGVDENQMLIKENITTIVSFFVPPIAGALYDKQQKRGSTYLRRFSLIMPIPFAITSLLLFIVPSSSAAFNFIWSLACTLIFEIADAFFDIAMATLGLRMCDVPSDRKNFFTMSSLASSLGSMLPGWIIPIIVGSTNDPIMKEKLYFIVALVFAIIGFGSMLLPYFMVKDRPAIAIGARQDDKKLQWSKEKVLAILHNRPFIVLQFSLLSDMIRQITYSLLPYLYEDTLGDIRMKAIIDTISGTLAYGGLLTVPFIGNKVSARNILVGGYSYTAFFYAIMSMFNINFNLEKIRKKRYIIGILIGFAGMPNYAQGASRKIIVADSTDYMEWYSEKTYGSAIRSDGILSSAQTLIGKFINLARANLYNLIFKFIGYKSKDLTSGKPTVQTPETLKGIFRTFTLCGLLGNTLSAIAFLFDNYTGKKKEAIYAELLEMRKKRNLSEE